MHYRAQWGGGHPRLHPPQHIHAHKPPQRPPPLPRTLAFTHFGSQQGDKGQTPSRQELLAVHLLLRAAGAFSGECWAEPPYCAARETDSERYIKKTWSIPGHGVAAPPVPMNTIIGCRQHLMGKPVNVESKMWCTAVHCCAEVRCTTAHCLPNKRGTAASSHVDTGYK